MSARDDYPAQILNGIEVVMLEKSYESMLAEVDGYRAAAPVPIGEQWCIPHHEMADELPQHREGVGGCRLVSLVYLSESEPTK